uniref:Pheromone binding protein 3 n=1 Tax=Manduca sexta TaxID=7130 RepID=Q9U508_MANSE|nr:pheromone binding protein 3 [Manduca sexta]
MAIIPIFTVLLMMTAVKEIAPSSDAMRHIANGFLKVLDQCKHELGLTDQIVVDLYQFWKLQYALLNRDTGCAIICMSKKLDLLDSTGRMHHGNTQEFAVSHGATDEVASKVVVIIRDCEKQQEGEEDDCVRVLEVAKCFRTAIHELNWAPNMEVVVDELLTER